MHQKQIQIPHPQRPQTPLQPLLNPRMKRTPQLPRNKQLLPLHYAPAHNVRQRSADFVFILVAERAVDVSVAALDGVYNRRFDFAGRGLPGSEAEGGDGGAGVEGDGGVHFGWGVEDGGGCGF